MFLYLMTREAQMTINDAKQMPKNQEIIDFWFFEHPRKVTKIENFLLFGMSHAVL